MFGKIGPVKRTFVDRDPGLLRPWIAKDGALLRFRVIGGEVPSASLRKVAEIADQFGDGRVYLTSRANLQIRGLPHDDGHFAPEFVELLESTGLFPSRSHDLVRNYIVSGLTGRIGGRADLRPIARELDERLCAVPEFAALPGLFWFSLDDGTGDVAHRSLDVGLVALDESTAQIRIGSHLWGETVQVTDAPKVLLEYARRFQMVRGTGNAALWHVDELPAKGREIMEREYPRDERTRLDIPEQMRFGSIAQRDGKRARHVEVVDGSLTLGAANRLAQLSEVLIVTQWRSIIAPDCAA